MMAKASHTAFGPLEPLHVQLHGPAPRTDEGLPTAHKSVSGLAVKLRPEAGPQAPVFSLSSSFFTASLASGAVHILFAPPINPAQVHSHVRFFLSNVAFEADPAAHSPTLGASIDGAPPAVPHEPSTAPKVEQETLWPPSATHCHVHGPFPSTEPAVPFSHNFSCGGPKGKIREAAPHRTPTDDVAAVSDEATPDATPTVAMQLSVEPP